MSKRFSFSAINIALLNPKGFIAVQQKHLLLMTILLMLIVVVPAYFMLIRFGFKYRAGNREGKVVEENKERSWVVWLWWLIPASIISILAVNTWHSTHALDPHKAIASNNPPITIQVIALQWKWLFIYPEQHIATVNFVEFPVNTPVKFELTADNATMNSLWIPQLGGQMYAMTSMSSQLHIMANEIGDYQGSPAEINGQGFAGMRFVARATSQKDFDTWIQTVKSSGNDLSPEKYATLVNPTENVTPIYYSAVENGLYNSVMMKYMNSMDMTH